MKELLQELSNNIVLESGEVFFDKQDSANICGITTDELEYILKAWVSNPKKCVYLSGNELLYEIQLIGGDYVTSTMFFCLVQYSGEKLKRSSALSFLRFLLRIGVTGKLINIDECKITSVVEYRDNLTLKRKSKKLDTPESQISNRLAKALGGKREVSTPAGRIDVLTATEVIEIKKSTEWKNGVGQIQAYQLYYPTHGKRLHLFGEPLKNLADVKIVCAMLDITLTHE